MLISWVYDSRLKVYQLMNYLGLLVLVKGYKEPSLNLVRIKMIPKQKLLACHLFVLLSAQRELPS